MDNPMSALGYLQPETFPTGKENKRQAIDPSISPEDLIRIEMSLKTEISTAFSAKDLLVKDVEKIRKYFMVERPEPIIRRRVKKGNKIEVKEEVDPSLPNYATPAVKAKVLGTISAYTKQLNKDPLIVPEPKSESDREASPAMELLFNQILVRSGSRDALLSSLVECAFTPSPLAVIEIVDEVPAIRLVRFENWATAPIDTADLRYNSVYIRATQPIWVMREWAKLGIYSEPVVQTLPLTSTKSTRTREAREKYGNEVSDYASDVFPVLVYECYYRYKGTLWHIYYAYDAGKILGIEKFADADAIGDRPPLHPIRSQSVVDLVYGSNPSTPMISYQELMDRTFNSAMIRARWEETNLIFADENSEFYRLMKNGTPIDPMRVYGTPGNPQQSVYVFETERKPVYTEHLGLFKSMVDMATVPDIALTGNPLQGIRSAAEVGTINSSANALLGIAISSISKDWSVISSLYWSYIYKYVVKPNGVLKVFSSDSSLLLSSQDIPIDLLRQYFVEYASTLGIPAEISTIASMSLTKSVLGADRFDISWTPTGSQLSSDKSTRAQILFRLLELTPFFQLAQEFAPVYYLLKSAIELLEVPFASKLLPAIPPTNTQAPQDALEKLAGIISGMKQGGGLSLPYQN